MKLFSIFIFIFSLHAQAASWVNVQIDHGNFQYNVGEAAKFYLQESSAPSNPAFRLKATIEFQGHGAPLELALTNGVGTYQSPILTLGAQNFRVITRLVSVPAGTYDQVLEDRIFSLSVLANPRGF